MSKKGFTHYACTPQALHKPSHTRHPAHGAGEHLVLAASCAPVPDRALSTVTEGTERLAWLYRPLPATPPARKHFWGVRIEPRGALWAGDSAKTQREASQVLYRPSACEAEQGLLIAPRGFCGAKT